MKKSVRKKNKKIYFLIAIVVISLFLLINLININKYGETVDEGSNFQRGNLTVSYLKSFIYPFDFPSGLKENSWLLRHPTFYATFSYLSTNFGRKVLGLNLVASKHLLNVLTASLGLIFLFLLARKMFDDKIGLYSLIFMIFFPRFIAHSHYNPKDIPVMALSIAALYFSYLAFKEKNKKNFILAGVFFAIAITTKLEALNLLFVFLISYLIFIFIKKTGKKINLKEEASLLLVFIFSIVVSIYIFWPFLWKNPFRFFSQILYFSREFINVIVLYLGNYHYSMNLPWHYLPDYVLLVTPVLTLIFFSVGIFVSFKKIIKKDKLFEYLLLLMWFFVPVLFRIFLGINMYNGVRHVFFIIPGLAMLAGVGLDFFENKLTDKFKKSGKKIFAVLLVVICLILIKEVLIIHPYEGSYFNEGVRFFIPENIHDNFHMEYWGATYLQGINWLNENAKENSKICIERFYSLGDDYLLREDLTLNPGCQGDKDYVMVIVAYGEELKYEDKDEYDLAYKISRYDSDLLRIYEVR